MDHLGCDDHEASAGPALVAIEPVGRALYTSLVKRAIVFPPPIPPKDFPPDVRRAARAFERVHEMLEAKKSGAHASKPKKPRRAA